VVLHVTIRQWRRYNSLKKKVIVDDKSRKVQIKKIVYAVHILLLLEKTDLQTETYL
jgi:hypothetical protein